MASDNVPALFARTDAGLYPVNDVATERLRRIPKGSIVVARIRQPRSIEHLRKYWAMVDLVARAMDWSSKVASDVIKTLAGYAVRIDVEGFGIVSSTESIAIESMDQLEFEAFYNRAVDAAVRITGASREDISREIALNF